MYHFCACVLPAYAEFLKRTARHYAAKLHKQFLCNAVCFIAADIQRFGDDNFRCSKLKPSDQAIICQIITWENININALVY